MTPDSSPIDGPAVAPLRSSADLLRSATSPVRNTDITQLKNAEELRNAGLNVQAPYYVSPRNFPDYAILVPTAVERPTTWVPMRVSRACLSRASCTIRDLFLADAADAANAASATGSSQGTGEGNMAFHHPFANAARISSLMRVLHRIDPISTLLPSVLEAYRFSSLLIFLDPSRAIDSIYREALDQCTQHVMDNLTPPVALDLWPEVAKFGPANWQHSMARYFSNNLDALQGAIVFDHDTLLQLLREPWLNYGEDALIDLALAWIEKNRPEQMSGTNLVNWQYALHLAHGIAWHKVTDASLWAARRGMLISFAEAGEIAELRFRLRNQEIEPRHARLFAEPLLERRDELHVERTGKTSFTALLTLPNFTAEKMPHPYHFKAGQCSWHISVQEDVVRFTYNGVESGHAFLRVFNNSGLTSKNKDFDQLWQRDDSIEVPTEMLVRNGNLDATILVNTR